MGLSALRKYATAATVDGICLRTAGTATIRANPTLAAGDVKISLNGGAFANLATLPSAVPASGKNIEVSLSSGEMTCARAVIIFSDAAGAEWDDFELIIETFGNASAQFAQDYSVANQAANVIQWNTTNVATPDTAGYPKVTIKSGTGTGELSLSSGLVTLAPVTHTNAVIPTVTNLTNLPSIPANWLTAAGIAAGALNGKGDWLLSSGYTAPPTTAAIATAIWQDATAGDFTVANSIGKALYIANVVPGAAGGHFIAGSNAATTVNFTGTISTVTNLTNLPSIPANWLTAAGIAAGALNGKGDWLLSSSITVVGGHVLSELSTHNGTAQAGGASSITLAAGASATNNFPGYLNKTIVLTGGTGAGQSNAITAYNGTTKVATVKNAWTTNPDATTTYSIEAVTAAVTGAGSTLLMLP